MLFLGELQRVAATDTRPGNSWREGGAPTWLTGGSAPAHLRLPPSVRLERQCAGTAPVLGERRRHRQEAPAFTDKITACEFARNG